MHSKFSSRLLRQIEILILSFKYIYIYSVSFTIQTHHEWTLIVPPLHFYASHPFQQSCVQTKRCIFVLCHIFQHHVQIWYFMSYICDINVQFQKSQKKLTSDFPDQLFVDHILEWFFSSKWFPTLSQKSKIYFVFENAYHHV